MPNVATIRRAARRGGDASPPALPGQGLGLADADQALACAELLAAGGDPEAAADLLQQAAAACPGDLRVREKLEDLDLAARRRYVELARQQAHDSPDSHTQQLVWDLEADLAHREIDVLGSRVGRYPEEHEWKITLAQCLKRIGNFTQAKQTLEDIPDSQPWKGAADLEMGECLQYERQFDRALAHYQRAAAAGPDIPPFSAAQQQALYRAGVLALQLGQTETAARYLRQLALEDPNYKDLPQHLDKIDSIRHKDGFSEDF